VKSDYDQFFKQAKKNSAHSRRVNGAKKVKRVNRAKREQIQKAAIKNENIQSRATQPTDAELAIYKALGLKQINKQRKGPLNIATLVGSIFIVASLSTLIWLGTEPWRLDQLMDIVEFGVFGDVHAASSDPSKSEKSSIKKLDQEAKNSSEKGQGLDSVDKVATKNLSYYKKLNEKRKELDLREKELSELEGELHKQKTEIEVRIQYLEKLRGQIAGVLKEKVEVDQEKVKKLVDFYSNMKPQQAAKIIGTINEDLAIEVLSQMKKKDAAAIMNLLDAEKAQILSEKFAGYKR